MENSLAVAEEVCTGNGLVPSMGFIGNSLSATGNDWCGNGLAPRMVLNW